MVNGFKHPGTDPNRGNLPLYEYIIYNYVPTCILYWEKNK